MGASSRPPGVDLFTLGEALVALVAADGVPLGLARRYDRWVVGAECNVAVGVARLGHTAVFAGRVGDDALGEAVRRFLREEGVDTSWVAPDPRGTTGLVVRDCPQGQPLSLAYYRRGSAGSKLEPSDVPTAAVRASRITHLSAITAMLSEGARAAVGTAAAAARAAGRSVTLDPNVRQLLGTPRRWREVVAELATMADTVLVGEDEMALVAGDRGPAWFLDLGVELVVVKHGAGGASATDGASTWHQPARPVPIVDPVGAGDAFAAGWHSARLRGLDVPDSLLEAAVVASCVVAARGDVDGLPTAAMRDHLVAAGADVLR